MQNNRKIKILHLEDSPFDAELIHGLIETAEMEAEIELVENKEDFESALGKNNYDVIIVDFMLPGFNAFGALGVVKKVAPHSPVICVSGAIGEETAIDVLKAGAVDYVLKDRLARLPSAITAAYDLSKEKRMRLIFEEENRTLSRALHQSPILISVTDRKGKIQFVNRKVTEFTGFKYGALVGQDISILAANSAGQAVIEEMWGTLLKGNEFRGELIGKKSDGSVFDASLVASSVVDEKGELAYYLFGMEDITNRKELEKNLLLEKEKAEVANRLKDAFISNLSHEIRTPLNGILGMAGIIEETYKPYCDREHEGYLMAMEKSVKRLIKTVEMLLSISKLQAGDYPDKPEQFSIGYLLENLLFDLTDLATEKGLHITTSIDPAYPVVTADIEAIKDVFTYIIDNAIKYTREGGIEVSTGTDKSGSVYARVKDTGVGISEEFKKELFLPFRQQETGLGRPFEGLGLGLPISKKLLELNGCSIEIESSVGVGTSVTVKFNRT